MWPFAIITVTTFLEWIDVEFRFILILWVVYGLYM